MFSGRVNSSTKYTLGGGANFWRPIICPDQTIITSFIALNKGVTIKIQINQIMHRVKGLPSKSRSIKPLKWTKSTKTWWEGEPSHDHQIILGERG
jgi:hypothetical protein